MDAKMDTRIDANRVLQELAAVAFSQVSQAYDQNWTPMPERAGAGLAAVEKTSSGIKLKFYDKLKALELLGKHFGLFDGSGGDETPKAGILEAFLKEDGDELSAVESPAEAGAELVEQNKVQTI